ncbi:Ubiquitin carboxyl-terminal hydrolase 4 [Diplonema papillatum]|nr:Ubiquitin carboxyl-terminal hydrolase 4 [Diplonema papillatum]
MGGMKMELFVPVDREGLAFEDYWRELKDKTKAMQEKVMANAQHGNRRVVEEDCEKVLKEANQAVSKGERDYAYYYYFLFVFYVGEVLLKHERINDADKKVWNKRLRQALVHVENPDLKPFFEEKREAIRRQKQEIRQRDQAEYLQKLPMAEQQERLRISTDEAEDRQNICMDAEDSLPEACWQDEADDIYLSQDVDEPTVSNDFGLDSVTEEEVLRIQDSARKTTSDLFDTAPTGQNGTLKGAGMSALLGPAPPQQQGPAPVESRVSEVQGQHALDSLFAGTALAPTLHRDNRREAEALLHQSDHVLSKLLAGQQGNQLHTQGDIGAGVTQMQPEAHIDPQAARLGAPIDAAMRAKPEPSKVDQRAMRPTDAQVDEESRLRKQKEAEEAAMKKREEAEEAAMKKREEAAMKKREEDALKLKEEEKAEQLELEEQLRVLKQQKLLEEERALGEIAGRVEPITRSALMLLEQCQHATLILQQLPTGVTRRFAEQKLPSPITLLEHDGEAIELKLRESLTTEAGKLAQLANEYSRHPVHQQAMTLVDTGLSYIEEARNRAELIKRHLHQLDTATTLRETEAVRLRRQLAQQGGLRGPQQRQHDVVYLNREVGVAKKRNFLHERQLKESYWTMNCGTPKQPRRGLVNLGNTCYMNSVLQCLMATELVKPFLGYTFTSDINISNPLGSRGCIVNTFHAVVEEMSRNVSYAVSPNMFKQAIGDYNETFQGQKQQDANEFMQTLLGCLHEDLNIARGREGKKVPELTSDGKVDEVVASESVHAYRINNRSLISELFGFLERSTVRCLYCNHRSVSFTVQHSLSIPIARQDNATLSDCLFKYTEQEQLPEGSEWKCGRCSRQMRAYKQLSLWSSPKVLVFTLNRFSTVGNLADKIRQDVRFPPTLDMRPFLVAESGPPVWYELCGIVNHDGGLGGGHYTAHVKGRLDESWYHFSDERVRPASGPPNFSQAYILFYRLANH